MEKGSTKKVRRHRHQVSSSSSSSSLLSVKDWGLSFEEIARISERLFIPMENVAVRTYDPRLLVLINRFIGHVPNITICWNNDLHKNDYRHYHAVQGPTRIRELIDIVYGPINGTIPGGKDAIVFCAHCVDAYNANVAAVRVKSREYKAVKLLGQRPLEDGDGVGENQFFNKLPGELLEHICSYLLAHAEPLVPITFRTCEQQQQHQINRNGVDQRAE